VQQARVALHVTRFVHHLRGGIELGIHIRGHLHDLCGRDQRALLTVHQLGNVPSLRVVAYVGLLFGREFLPHFRPVDRDHAIVELHRVLGIEVGAPVDPRGLVPLFLLGLAVQLQQSFPRRVVLPCEIDLALPVEAPAGLFDRQLIAVHGRHVELPSDGWVHSLRREAKRCK
jgi:hypothetical protein